MILPKLEFYTYLTSGINTGTHRAAADIRNTPLIKDSGLVTLHNILNTDEPIITATCVEKRPNVTHQNKRYSTLSGPGLF